MENIRKTDSGFTIIEILFVIVLMGALLNLSIVIPEQLLKKEKTQRAVFNMYSDICSLRNEGIFKLTQNRVRFYKNYNNTGQSAYVLQSLEDNKWKTKKRIILDKDLKIFSLTFPGSSVNQSFSYYGTPLYSGSVGLSGDSEEIFYLVFYSSGRIRIKKSA